MLANFSKTMLQRSNKPSLNKNYKIRENDTTIKNLNLLKLYDERKAIQLIDLSLNAVKIAKKDLKIRLSQPAPASKPAKITRQLRVVKRQKKAKKEIEFHKRLTIL